jgi:hypothetical protein
MRAVSDRLTRVNGYVTMAFAAAIGGGPPPDFNRGLQFISLARAACRDPDPGVVGPALARIDGLLAGLEQRIAAGAADARAAFGLGLAAGVIAATEPPIAAG